MTPATPRNAEHPEPQSGVRIFNRFARRERRMMGNITRRNLTPRPPLPVERGRKNLSPDCLSPVIPRSESDEESRSRLGPNPFDRDPSALLGMTGGQAAGANEDGRNP
jgi:hypothetical protein